MSADRRSRRRGWRGYTMFEVMMALSILGIGALGIMALQKATGVGNNNARALATANAIALSWVERLRMDALQWNNPGGVNDLNQTRWLLNVTTTPGIWFSPVEVASTASNRADILGTDIFANDTTPVVYCTHIRLSNLFPGLLRAEVRTVWIKSMRAMDCNNVLPASIDLDATTPKPVGYGAVYVTTAIMNNVTPGG